MSGAERMVAVPANLIEKWVHERLEMSEGQELRDSLFAALTGPSVVVIPEDVAREYTHYHRASVHSGSSVLSKMIAAVRESLPPAVPVAPLAKGDTVAGGSEILFIDHDVCFLHHVSEDRYWHTGRNNWLGGLEMDDGRMAPWPEAEDET